MKNPIIILIVTIITFLCLHIIAITSAMQSQAPINNRIHVSTYPLDYQSENDVERTKSGHFMIIHNTSSRH